MLHDGNSSAIFDKRKLESLLTPLLVATLAAAAARLMAMINWMQVLHDTGSSLYELALKNQILQAFVASSLLGILSYIVLLVGRTCISWLRGRTFCSITISNKDESFTKVIDYIGKQGIVSSGCLVASTQQKKKTWKDWRSEFLMGVRAPPRMVYQPANNNDVHVITYRGNRILMHRTKGETVVAGWERVPMEMETLTLSSFGSRVEPLKQLIDDALLASFDEQQDELSVFVLNDMWGGSWEKALSKKPRAINSVILDEDLADGLLTDARSFLGASEWYQSVGIPYRRGYLLHGPPGCGKTSFCQALAGELKLDLCMLTLTNKNLNDNGLAECLRDAPANAIVLLEDVDAVFVDRAVKSENGQAPGVTFSGLLNALDGVASQEGRLFFMTTNHIEKLDEALIRPGRCDVKVEVRRASRPQARKLYERFFPDAPECDALAFAQSLPEYELSMAALQGHLLEHKADPLGALRHVQRLLRASKPLRVDRMSVFDHLRRVGLEGWAALFEYHGYSLKADLRGLTIETVKSWSGALRIDARACKRMELLLAEDAALMAEYQLIDSASAKELFIAVFGSNEDQAPLESTDEDNQTTYLTNVSKPEPILRLADKLCKALQRDGKAMASVWQVRRHLHLFAHSATEAVARAGCLMEPTPSCGVDGLAIDELSAYDWLRRVGLEKHVPALEDQGYSTARSLYGLTESILKDDCNIKDKVELKRLTILFGTDTANARTLLSLTSPDYAALRAAFLQAFANATEQADRFASALSNRAGHGLISVWQLEKYLKDATGKDAAEAASEAKAQLVEHRRPPRERPTTPPPPTEWVYGWLKEKQLETYAAKLIEANFVEKADLQIQPRLTLDELQDKIGVDKLADARKLFNLIKEL